MDKLVIRWAEVALEPGIKPKSLYTWAVSTTAWPQRSPFSYPTFCIQVILIHLIDCVLDSIGLSNVNPSIKSQAICLSVLRSSFSLSWTIDWRAKEGLALKQRPLSDSTRVAGSNLSSVQVRLLKPQKPWIHFLTNFNQGRLPYSPQQFLVG